MSRSRNPFFPKLNRGAHHSDTSEGGAIPPGTRYFCDKTVGTQQVYQSGNTYTTSTLFNRVFGLLAEQMLSNVAVAETFDEIFTPEHVRKQSMVIFSQRIEPATSLIAITYGFTESAEHRADFCRVFDNREGLQIVIVGRPRDFEIAIEIGHTLRHREPAYSLLAVAYSRSTNLKFIRTIDNRFYPQYASMFIVHFNPVIFHPVFNPCTGPTVLEFVENLPFKASVQFSSEKSQYILSAETHRCVPEQFFIQTLESSSTVEQDIRRELSLIDDPVVFGVFEYIFKQRVDPACKSIEHTRPFLFDEVVAQVLSTQRFLDGYEGIVQPFVADIVSVHFACQPLMTIDIDLDLKRKPRLDANMHQPKLTVNKIEIEKQALAIGLLQLWSPIPISQSKTTARFDGGQDTDQSFSEMISLDDFLGQFFFSRASIKIDERTVISSSHILCMRFKPLSLLEDEGLEILYQNAMIIHEPLHCLWIAKRQVSFEYDTVEAFQGCGNLGFVLFDKCFHDVLLAMAVSSLP